jgi:hypothetical protein
VTADGEGEIRRGQTFCGVHRSIISSQRRAPAIQNPAACSVSFSAFLRRTALLSRPRRARR